MALLAKGPDFLLHLQGAQRAHWHVGELRRARTGRVDQRPRPSTEGTISVLEPRRLPLGAEAAKRMPMAPLTQMFGQTPGLPSVLFLINQCDAVARH
jgi:hypothetical protein